MSDKEIHRPELGVDENGDAYFHMFDENGETILTIDKDGMKDENGELIQKNNETNNGWISVKDRLPEKDQPVLLIVHGQSFGFEHGIHVGRLHDVPGDDGTHNFAGAETPSSEWEVLAWSYYVKPEPVYWMPLPEPPQED